MRKIFLTIILSFLIVFATHAGRPLDISQLTVGMTTNQVEQYFGSADKVLEYKQTKDGMLIVLRYDNSNGENYALEFWDDQLVGYEYLDKTETYVAPIARPAVAFTVGISLLLIYDNMDYYNSYYYPSRYPPHYVPRPYPPVIVYPPGWNHHGGSHGHGHNPPPPPHNGGHSNSRPPSHNGNDHGQSRPPQSGGENGRPPSHPNHGNENGQSRPPQGGGENNRPIAPPNQGSQNEQQPNTRPVSTNQTKDRSATTSTKNKPKTTKATSNNRTKTKNTTTKTRSTSSKKATTNRTAGSKRSR